ncbi:MAG: fibronectin type III domain-containing protein [Actinomycetota bacterium]
MAAPVALVMLVMARAAFGSWAGSVSASHSLSTATLEPVSGLTVATGCSGLLDLLAKADLSWTATPSGFAEGYKVERWQDLTVEATAVVTPRTSTTSTQTGLATGTTYTWKVYAYAHSWTSTIVAVTATTPALCL